MLEEFKDKKIVILGIGQEGLSTLRFLRKIFPGKKVTISDQKTQDQLDASVQSELKNQKDIDLILGTNYLESLPKFDLVIKSPGIPSSKIERFIGKNTQITSQAEIFFKECKGTIIGVTGTKGKSTTASLIAKILKDSGKKVFLVGNIGNPPINYLESPTKEKIFVYELSSYQLADLKQSPHIAVVLNIFPEHLNFHGDFQKYVQAKKNITKWQSEGDFLIYDQDSSPAKEIAKESKATKIQFSLSQKIDDGYFKNTKIKTKLLGDFNFKNILAAMLVAKIFNISQQSQTSSIKSFKPLKHRLEFVCLKNGIKFYNDSLATNPQATIAALTAFKREIGTLMLGGYDRGLDFTSLAKEVISSNIKTIILFPKTGEKILEAIQKENRKAPAHFFAKTMKEAVFLAAEFTDKGKVCLLSPASPSFGLFKNYQDRGEQFIKAVMELKNETN